MAPPILKLDGIRHGFGGDMLLDGADLVLGPRERLCLVGRNGCGKSTLLKIAAGLIEPMEGERFLQPGTTLRYLEQEPDLSGHGTALSYVEAGLGPDDPPFRARYLLEKMGFDGTEDPATLSGGERRRAALAAVLAPRPDILLLDEPTNHLDLPAIEWLEGELASTRSALILVSHDRRFLETLSESALWIDRGAARKRNGGFAGFEDWRDGILEQEAVERHKLNRRIAAETEWLRRGVTARRKRNMGRLRALHDLRQQRSEQRTQAGTVSMTATEGQTSGKVVIEARAVSKGFDGRQLVRGFSTRIQRGDRVGIVGANGAGKTTLLTLLTGALAPDSGRVKLGSALEMATLDQNRDSLDPSMTLQDALTGGGGDSVTVGGKPRHVVSYLKDFLFLPEQARTPISALSGGERGRLMLARALARPSNLLVLDEPTNDLDLETLDLLQELLTDYAGTVLLVSHDRDFLDRVVTTVIAGDGDGNWTEYAGGYTDMLAQGGSGVEARTTPEKTRPPEPSKPQAPKARAAKLSFKDKHALETLPAAIADLEAEIARLNAALADPDYYSRDAAGFEAASAALQKATDDLAAAETEWLRLEMLREALAAG